MLGAARNLRRFLARTGSRTATTDAIRPKISYLDLRGSGLSILERLVLEEAILRHDPQKRCWAIVGTHDPTYNTRLRRISSADFNSEQHRQSEVQGTCAIVLGIGGKPSELVNMPLAKQDSVLMIKRFSGGGTVVVDHSSLFTSFIGRDDALPHVMPYPREIMSWSAEAVFVPTFRKLADMVSDGGATKVTPTLIADSKSGLTNLGGRSIEHDGGPFDAVPEFTLRDNDYVLGERKVAGNAQAITNVGWIHHTSFLWDYDENNMKYLTLPPKRPEYRGDRSHDDFLVKLSDYYSELPGGGKHEFFAALKEATNETFEVENAVLDDVLEFVDIDLGGIQTWYGGKCRTRVLDWKDVLPQ